MNVFEDYKQHRFVDDGISKYIVEYIYNHISLSSMEKENLHTKILTYMVSRNERDVKRYLNYLIVSKPVNSKTLKLHYEAIANKVKNEINEMKNLINGLEARKT